MSQPPLVIEPIHDEERNRFTTITATAESVDFSTTDHEGGNEEGFELTWPEVYRLCREYQQ